MARDGHHEIDAIWLGANGDAEPCPMVQDDRKVSGKVTLNPHIARKISG